MRIALMVFRLFFKAIGYVAQISYCGLSKKVSLEKTYRIIQNAARNANRAGRVTVEVHGEENIPKEDGFIFFPNHQGLFDVLAFLATSPRPFSFVYKKEANNLPLVKQVARALHAYAIDREDIRQSMTVIQAMTEDVKSGRNFLIFAEGTRSRQVNKLLDFKGGSFKSATKARCPIVPCALIDSFKPFDEQSIKPVTVKLFYLPPMYYEEYKDMKTVEIAAEVKRRIEQVHMEEGCE